MQINFTFDQSTTDLPSGMVQALDIAASYLEHLIANPITVNIEVGYGEITQNGNATSVTFGAEGGPDNEQLLTYGAFRNLYAANLTTPAQRLALANFPSVADPPASNIVLASTQLKALGQLPATDAAADGSVGFQLNNSGGIVYDFNPFARAVSGEWDFIGSALHEITHAMGRISDLGQSSTRSVLDLFRYSAPGQLQSDVNGSTAYFSLDGGYTPLNSFDTTDTDPADWAASVPNDANDVMTPVGAANDFGLRDLLELNALGFQRLAQTDDFEGKGTSDIIWSDGATGAVSEWRFANGVNIGDFSMPSAPGEQILATGDFNRDGTSDVLWRNTSTGDVSSWLMRRGRLAWTEDYGVAPGDKAIVGNFAGTGVSEIVWQNSTTGALTEWLMAGGQPFYDQSLGAEAGRSVLGAGDFNGDGTTDLLVQNSAGEVSDWLMTRGRVTASNDLGNMGGSTYLGAGDFTGAVTTDLLWRNNATNDVQEWIMSNGVVGAKVDLGVVAGASVAATGDYYGTGTSDILWQNASTGATTIWAMLNGQHVSAYDVGLASSLGMQTA